MQGAYVELVEQSRFPRHKVCGEFLSPEILEVLGRLNLESAFRSANPARIDRVSLQFGRNRRTSTLPEAAYGLSRFSFDQLLNSAAQDVSAPLFGPPTVTVRATGRGTKGAPAKGERLFGFKAHFEGPANDAVELYFFDGCYVGINAVEDGRTNVCGLGPERVLKRFGFEVDGMMNSVPALRERISCLTRCFDWLFVGPLVFRNRLSDKLTEGDWPTGDALSFVDPFTGSGLLSALLTGEIAGKYAADGRSVHEYASACRKVLGRQFACSAFLRSAAGTRLAETLVSLVPGDWLFRITRPVTI